MEYLYLVVLGLVVGVLAKWIMPGRDPGGIIVTILLGIAGAFIGKYVGALVGFTPMLGFNFKSVALSTACAVGLLIIYRIIRRR
jgi:uncharacterized membrane protein YeaQ/YmgE (transglycosylase-associated protein family)